jgi:Fibronectin type III domain.
VSTSWWRPRCRAASRSTARLRRPTPRRPRPQSPAPTAGATLSATTTVTASASDNVGVSKVEFYLDGALTATDTATPYNWNWVTTSSANGAHTLSSKAYDAAGNNATSTLVSVTVSNDVTPPVTSITAPTGGAAVSGITPVTASASDDVGVARVEFYLDGALQATSTSSPYTWSWDSTLTANGVHSLTSRAFDAAGNSGTSAAVSVTVSNAGDTTPPSVPAGLAASGTKRKITLTWIASTDNVAVTGYQIWRATSAAGTFTQLATTTSTTYANSSLASGSTFYYYVRAYDAAGNVSAASTTVSATAR